MSFKSIGCETADGAFATRMNMKISTRFFLSISTLLILTSIGLGYISVRDERLYRMNAVRTEAGILANILATTFKYYHMGDQHQRIGELIHAVMPHEQKDHDMRINLYDRQGDLMDFSFEHGIEKISSRQVRKLDEVLTGTREVFFTDAQLEYYAVVRPIRNSAGELQGAVEVVFSLDKINKTLSGLVRKFVIFILLTAFLLGILIYLISRWSISQPIARLKEASEKLGRGDLGLRIEKSGARELDDLIEEFNRMAYNIEQQHAKREQLFTEKITLEKNLRHADKLASIGQLASGLAHEIGTPLNVISGRGEYLLKKMGADHPEAKNVTIVIRQAERITKIMQQLLAFARKPAAHFASISLEKAAGEAFSLCQLRQGETDPQRVMELDLEVQNLTADEDGLRQLLVNLMLNSFHALPSGGKIRITSRCDREDEKESIVTYEDNGPGVPQDKKDRIFDPFFTTKDVGEGTGLGLFIVANIVQEHQGRVELDYDFTGGARFVIHFPSSVAGTNRQTEES